ncbi:hypothetical protein QBA35_10995 [Streptomyces bottropensis]|uniref:Alpha/beta hydrolase n=1 Tax=Streptomyces bottropensis TaxID=42235 RepID=A0ABU8AJM7_9ACTN
MERRVYERAGDLSAGYNHTLAGAAGGDDTAALASVTAPTLVLHGTEARCFRRRTRRTPPPPFGRDVGHDRGAGHTLPTALDARLAEEILRHTA